MAISLALRSIAPKGADFFGISHPTIQNLIQSTPGTRKLVMYKQQRFEVSNSKFQHFYTIQIKFPFKFLEIVIYIFQC